MKKISLFIITLCLSMAIFGQMASYNLDEEIQKILSSSDLEKYKEAKDLFSQGDKLKNDADKIQSQAYNLEKKMDTMKKRKRRKAKKQYDKLQEQSIEKYNSAYVKYFLGYKKLYKIYDTTLRNISSRIKSDNRNDFERLLTSAQSSYETAMSYVRKGVKEKKNQQKKYDYYKQAYSYFEQMIENHNKAFKIYFDQLYGVNNKTNIAKQTNANEQKQQASTLPQTEVSQPITLHDEPTSSQQQTSISTQTEVSQPIILHDEPRSSQQQTSIPPQTEVSQPIILHDEPRSSQQQTSIPPNYSYATKENYARPQSQDQSNKSESNIYFRVQVAASRVPLSKVKLQQIYAGRIYIEYDSYDGYYKYLTAEKFSTYDLARSFKYSCGVPGAFVVAYKNNERVRDICEVVPCRR